MTTPWYYRSSVLLGTGAAAIVLALLVVLVAGGDDGEAKAPSAAPVSSDLVDTARYTTGWLFKDPNRALGDGIDSLESRPAVWALDRLAVVASVDTVRGHALGTGAVRWNHPVKGQVCGAATAVPHDSRIVVIAEDEDCSVLTAIAVRTGKTVWQARTDDLFQYESIVMAPVGVVVQGDDGITVYDRTDGSVLREYTEDQLGAATGRTGVRVTPEAPAAPSADGSVIVFTGRTFDDDVTTDGPVPTVAFGLDARTGRLRWHTQLTADDANTVPQAHDGTFLVVQEDPDAPGKLVHLDGRSGKVRSTIDIPADSRTGGRAEYERYSFDGPAWYRSGTAFAGGDPIVTFSNVDYDGEGSAQVQHLVRVDAETGKEVWRLRPQDLATDPTDATGYYSDLAAGPMLDARRMLVAVGSLKGSFLAVIDVRTGKVLGLGKEPQAVGTSRIQQEPGVFVVDGGVLLAFNPAGGTNQIDEDAEQGKDSTSLVLLRPGAAKG